MTGRFFKTHCRAYLLCSPWTLIDRKIAPAIS